MARQKDRVDQGLGLCDRVLGLATKAVSSAWPIRKKDSKTDAAHMTQAFCSPKDVYTRDVYISRDDGSCLRLLVLSLKGKPRAATGVLWIHGGEFVSGVPEVAYLGLPLHMLRERPCIVVCPDYRLASEMPFPGGLEDCHLALMWLSEHARELGVRVDQLFVGGECAGGGLAAALCLYERDLLRAGRSGVPVACQMPICPMLDDRTAYTVADGKMAGWNTEFNVHAWDLYLAGMDRQHVVPYAASARETSYAGMPPAITFVGSVDPVLNETVAYVRALRRDGVPADFRVYRGCLHTSSLQGDSTEAREARAFMLRHFAKACDSYATQTD